MSTPGPPEPLALDVSLEKARALHRVWRALNDGDCPKCHRMHAATFMRRYVWLGQIDSDEHRAAVMCPDPTCGFYVTVAEITEIEKLFAPAMDAAVAIFEAWRAERQLPEQPALA